MTGAELGRAVGDFVNGASKKDIQEFVEELTSRTHRTLQQGAMTLFLRCIETWAAAFVANRYDLRNEATCKLAKTIVDATGGDDKYARALPHI